MVRRFKWWLQDLVVLGRVWRILPSWQVLAAPFSEGEPFALREGQGAFASWWWSRDQGEKFARGLVQFGLDEGTLWVAQVGQVDELVEDGHFMVEVAGWALPKGFILSGDGDDVVVRRA